MKWVKVNKAFPRNELDIPEPPKRVVWEDKPSEPPTYIRRIRVQLEHIGMGIWLKYVPENNTMYWKEE